MVVESPDLSVEAMSERRELEHTGAPATSNPAMGV